MVGVSSPSWPPSFTSTQLSPRPVVEKGYSSVGSPVPVSFSASLASPRLPHYESDRSPQLANAYAVPDDSAKRRQEQEQLFQQVTELRAECLRLGKEGEEQEQHLVSEASELQACNLRCVGLEELARLLKEQLSQVEAQVGAVAKGASPLEVAALEFRQQLAIGDRSEDCLRIRLGAALRISGGLSGERAQLERRSFDAAGELEGARGELEETLAKLQGAEDDSVVVAAALEMALAASKKRVQEAQNEATVLLSEARACAGELPQVRQELAALANQLAAGSSQTQVKEAATNMRMLVLQERAQGLAASAALAREEARGSQDVQVALRKVRADNEACLLEIELCRKSEASLQEKLARERSARHAEEQSAARSVLVTTSVEEQRLVDAAFSEEQRLQLSAAACYTNADLCSELAHANAVVATSSQSLCAIQEQLHSLKRLRAHLEVTALGSEVAAGELQDTTSRLETMQREALSRVQKLKAEKVALQQKAASASISYDSRLEDLERQCRNLVRQVGQLETDQEQRAESAVVEERHRDALEGRLRADLRSAEGAWEAEQAKLEARNAGLAREAVRLDDERRQADAELEEVQASLEARVEAATGARSAAACQLEAAKQRARVEDQDPQETQVVAELNSEADELRIEQGRLRQAVKRVEALNAGLRAQVHVCQQHQAEDGRRMSPLL